MVVCGRAMVGGRLGVVVCTIVQVSAAIVDELTVSEIVIGLERNMEA